LLKRITVLLFATLAIFSLGVSPANADPGHQTIGCGVGDSTGWQSLSLFGLYRGSACMSVFDHGSHVDVSYWLYDGRADGYDLNGYRNLSWVDDGWVYVVSGDGYDTYSVTNKMYDDPAGVDRWVAMKGKIYTGVNTYDVWTSEQIPF